jgi:hypothetical protein
MVGIMGTNSRGMFLAKSFAKLPNVEIAYICDPDANVLAKTIAEIDKMSGKRPQAFAGVRKCWRNKILMAWQLPLLTIGIHERPSWLC